MAAIAKHTLTAIIFADLIRFFMLLSFHLRCRRVLLLLRLIGNALGAYAPAPFGGLVGGHKVAAHVIPADFGHTRELVAVPRQQHVGDDRGRPHELARRVEAEVGHRPAELPVAGPRPIPVREAANTGGVSFFLKCSCRGDEIGFLSSEQAR